MRKSTSAMLGLLVVVSGCSMEMQAAPQKPRDPNELNRKVAIANITEYVMESLKDPEGATLPDDLLKDIALLEDDNHKKYYLGTSYVRVENKYGGHNHLNFLFRVSPDGSLQSVNFTNVE